MPNIEKLIDYVSHPLTDTQNSQQAYFITTEVKNAYNFMPHLAQFGHTKGPLQNKLLKLYGMNNTRSTLT